MLTQHYLPSKVEDSVSFVTRLREQGRLFDRWPGTETWQMDKKSYTAGGYRAAMAINNGQPRVDGQCSMAHLQSCSQLSSVSTVSESSAPTMVYQRRRLTETRAPPRCPNLLANSSSDTINFVYERRKHRKISGTNVSTIASTHTSPNTACNSGTRSDILSVPSKQKTRRSLDTEAAGVCSTCEVVCNKELPLMASETVHRCVVEGPGSHSKGKMKAIVLHSVDDSCSSSMLDMENGSGSSKTEADDTDECSTSGMLGEDVMGDTQFLSAKDLCISILRSHDLLSDSAQDRCTTSEEDPPSSSGSRCSRSCSGCGVTGPADDMLICDECEEAFHMSCSNTSARKMPLDDWYCQSCFKNKYKMIKEAACRRSSIITSASDRVPTAGDLSPIELMLNENEPHTSNVRVGKGFQAIVPPWSGPVTEDIDGIPEPMELDLSDSVNLPGLISRKPPDSSFIGNWIQCREVVVGTGGGVDGTICGKWRRAPLFEVQTDKWDCFRSVFWDPIHADCAVPQELETDEVLKQLKYLDMLRPSLTGKRRKLDMGDNNGLLVT